MIPESHSGCHFTKGYRQQLCTAAVFWLYICTSCQCWWICHTSIIFSRFSDVLVHNQHTAERNVSTQTAAGFPSSAFTFLLSPFCVAACHSKKRDSRGQDCMPISNWINVCLLSVIFYVLRKSLCSSAQVLSDTLIRRMGQLRVLLLRQKANEGFLLLVIQKRFSHAAHALNQIQIFELFWSLLWYADCLVGEYFNHTKVRYRHFSFHF